MKIAQEIRAGNVIMHGKDPMVVLKTEYSRGDPLMEKFLTRK